MMVGAGSSTWKWSGGTWRITPCGIAGRWVKKPWVVIVASRPPPARWPAQLGYAGLKWPKSVGPEGRSAPWEGNQVLLWKEPHPIFFADLDYRLHPTFATLDKWADVVQGTTEHMADYPTRDEKTGLYSLVPAMPPSELGVTRDTVFDLAYWRFGLDRRGMASAPRPRAGTPLG